ncbi:hypothetical protein [Kitasatospora cineracea]|uniref:Lipoprotein n=1 Tax=Kitasatospora cineracea TaxID=88074 RepID=A0A8G1UAS8_9ACTN|nr:hypothetical protein [Kitasatospora cineracea]ROR37318.1 hypothetical protein EDD39_5451 [Kitasatospora cineracea]
MTRSLARTAASALALLTTGLLPAGCGPAENAGAAPPGPGASPSPARAARACLRNPHDPHPGDPGGGGGTGVVVGDRVYRTDSGGGAGTRCDGKGERPPRYEVDKVFVRQTLIGTAKPKATCPGEAAASFTPPNPPGTLAPDPTTACAEPVG